MYLVITFKDGQEASFKLDSNRGWRIATESRQIIIGRGVPRTMVPLDNVLYYEVRK